MHRKICGVSAIYSKYVHHLEDEYKVLGKTRTNLHSDNVKSVAEIVENLMSFTDVSDVMEALCGLFCTEIQDATAEMSISAVLVIMQKFEDVVGIQTRSCALLASFGHSVGMASYSLGMRAAVLNAMAKFPDSPKLQGSACAAIVGLGSLRTPEGRSDESMITALVKAMQIHPDDYDVQQNGCLALSGLSRGGESNKALIVDSGGLDVVALASQKFWGDKGWKDS